MKKYFKGGMMSPVVEQIHWIPVAANTPMPVDHDYHLRTSPITSSERMLDPNGEMSQDSEVSVIKSEILEMDIKSEHDEELPNQLSPNICEDDLQYNSCQTMSIYQYQEKNEIVDEIVNEKFEYIFCRDYQNKTCTIPNCKYVHATIFEQERYHESGVLPPEALSHINRQNANTRTLYQHSPAIVSVPEISHAVPINIRLTPPPPPPDFSTLPPNHQYELPTLTYTSPERQIIVTEGDVTPDSQAHHKPLSKQSKPSACRDYLRNKCIRINCHYRHPKEEERVAEILKEICDYTFCRDFQNTKKCAHFDCKYVHATMVEEVVYKMTGVLPLETVSHIYKKNASTTVVSEPETVFAVPNTATMPPPPPIQTLNSMAIALPNLTTPPPPIRPGQALQIKFGEGMH